MEHEGAHVKNMVFRSFRIVKKMPCIADPQKLRVIAKVEGELYKAFPYLNRIREDAVYSQALQTITLKNGEKTLTISPTHITMTLIEDENEANRLLEELKNLINSVYEKKDQIEPLFEMRKNLKVKDIIQYLPRTDCKQCGERSCFAFAYKLLNGETELKRCKEIEKEDYYEMKQTLYEILRNHGYLRIVE